MQNCNPIAAVTTPC